MNKKVLILPAVLLGLGLASCKRSNTVDQTITVVSSKGLAAVALAGQISLNTYTFANDNALASVEISRNGKDVVVCDAVTGLNELVKNTNKNYGLTKVVSYNQDRLVKLNASLPDAPTSDHVVVSYGKGTAGDKAFRKMYKEPTAYVSTAKDVLNLLKTGEYKEQTIDYVVIDAATYDVAKKDVATYQAATNSEVVAILAEKWAEYTEAAPNVEQQKNIPGLVTFVSKGAADQKATGLEGFYTTLAIGVKNAVEKVENTTTAIKAYSSKAEQQIEMFGATAEAIETVQANNANGLGLLATEQPADIASYMAKFLEASFIGETTETHSTLKHIQVAISQNNNN